MLCGVLEKCVASRRFHKRATYDCSWIKSTDTAMLACRSAAPCGSIHSFKPLPPPPTPTDRESARALSGRQRPGVPAARREAAQEPADRESPLGGEGDAWSYFLPPDVKGESGESGGGRLVISSAEPVVVQRLSYRFTASLGVGLTASLCWCDASPEPSCMECHLVI